MDDRIDHDLREALAGRPRPEVRATFTAEVLRAVAGRERLADQRSSFGGRLLLAGYWLAAGIASLSLLRTLGWPPWVTSALWGLALVLVPFACAAFLWPHRLRAWALLCLHPLLGEPRARTPTR